MLCAFLNVCILSTCVFLLTMNINLPVFHVDGPDIEMSGFGSLTAAYRAQVPLFVSVSILTLFAYDGLCFSLT